MKRTIIDIHTHPRSPSGGLSFACSDVKSEGITWLWPQSGNIKIARLGTYFRWSCPPIYVKVGSDNKESCMSYNKSHVQRSQEEGNLQTGKSVEEDNLLQAVKWLRYQKREAS
jgi:hypothetical protein